MMMRGKAKTTGYILGKQTLIIHIYIYRIRIVSYLTPIFFNIFVLAVIDKQTSKNESLIKLYH